jgi:benzylsuccinate CoA-transferase BbsF subunit
VTHLLQAAGVPAFTSCSNKDISEDPHLNQAGFFVQREHPEVGKRQHVGIPWRMSDTPCEVRRAAPTLGGDTDHVMSKILSYSTEEIRSLKETKVLN